MRLQFKIQISHPRGYQEPDTQVASLGCTHYFPALAFLWLILASLVLLGRVKLMSALNIFQHPAYPLCLCCSGEGCGKITQLRCDRGGVFPNGLLSLPLHLFHHIQGKIYSSILVVINW